MDPIRIHADTHSPSSTDEGFVYLTDRGMIGESDILSVTIFELRKSRQRRSDL